MSHHDWDGWQVDTRDADERARDIRIEVLEEEARENQWAWVIIIIGMALGWWHL